MSKELSARLLSVRDIFSNQSDRYTIPVYQRNYAWGEAEIEQLINDINDARKDDSGKEAYFIGNIVATNIEVLTSDLAEYEVVDGQQRLTTLFFILAALNVKDFNFQDRLQYRVRARSTEALRQIAQSGGDPINTSLKADESILLSYNHIGTYLKQVLLAEEFVDFENYLLDKVQMVRALLPAETDLNRYFEIMNTRGQQLQQVDIVKAYLMSLLPESHQSVFVWIWDACSNMDSYIQMALTPKNTEARDMLFGEKWDWLQVDDFMSLQHAYQKLSETVPDENSGAAPQFARELRSLDEAINYYETISGFEDVEDPDNVRFRSTIQFPAFLLHVLKVFSEDSDVTYDDDISLDDKKLVERFKQVFSQSQPSREGSPSAEQPMVQTKFGGGLDERAERVWSFVVTLLRLRNYFDAFVVKRQFTAANSDDGDWSLQRLVKGKSNGSSIPPRYLNTAGSKSDYSADGDNLDVVTGDLLQLESMLRVTYTAPRTMRWITEVLRYLASVKLAEIQKSPSAVVSNLNRNLRNYVRLRVSPHLADLQIPQKLPWFNVPRIVFNYLDYLLVHNGVIGSDNSRAFRFGFRNSTEHFFPQNESLVSDNLKTTKADDPKIANDPNVTIKVEDKNLFGNLALVSVSANSKFSNIPPISKAGLVDVIAQSPKLQIMAKIAQDEAAGGWNHANLVKHHNEMLSILLKDIGATDNSWKLPEAHHLTP